MELAFLANNDAAAGSLVFGVVFEKGGGG
jgi:hypothetical protein